MTWHAFTLQKRRWAVWSKMGGAISDVMAEWRIVGGVKKFKMASISVTTFKSFFGNIYHVYCRPLIHFIDPLRWEQQTTRWQWTRTCAGPARLFTLHTDLSCVVPCHAGLTSEAGQGQHGTARFDTLTLQNKSCLCHVMWCHASPLFWCKHGISSLQ